MTLILGNVCSVYDLCEIDRDKSVLQKPFGFFTMDDENPEIFRGKFQTKLSLELKPKGIKFDSE